MRRDDAPGRGRRRSFVILAVLVVVASALLVGTGLLFVVQAHAAGAAGESDRLQQRLLAWSGVQAVVSRLNEQRDRILRGETPELDEEYVIDERAGVTTVVRLLPIAPNGARVVPEAGRLDANVADASMLEATGMVDARTAAAVVSEREQRPFGSMAELLQVRGLGPEDLYGPLEEIARHAGELDDDRDAGARMADRLAGSAPRGLADVVTVYAVEPALQRDGRRRINLDVPYSEELGRRVDERFGAGASDMLRAMMERGTRFEEDGDIVAALVRAGTPVEEWPDIVDALTTSDALLRFGRVDINTAPREVLAALPGIDEGAADRIVQARDSVDQDDRGTIVWPAIEGILEPEAYEDLAGMITTRTWTYRVRIAAVERRDDERRGRDEGRRDRPSPVILEAVIDLAEPRPRVAYLRDVSMLATTAALAGADLETAGERTEDVDRAADPRPARGGAVEPGAAARPGRAGRTITGRTDPPGSRTTGREEPDEMRPSDRPFDDDNLGPRSGARGGRARIGRWLPGPASTPSGASREGSGRG